MESEEKPDFWVKLRQWEQGNHWVYLIGIVLFIVWFCTPYLVELLYGVKQGRDTGSVGSTYGWSGTLISGAAMFLVLLSLISQRKALALQEKQVKKQIQLAADSARIANMPMLIESLKTALLKASEEEFVKNALSPKDDRPLPEVLFETLKASARGAPMYGGRLEFDTERDVEISGEFLRAAFVIEVDKQRKRLKERLFNAEPVEDHDRGIEDVVIQLTDEEAVEELLAKRVKYQESVEKDLKLLSRLYSDQKELYEKIVLES